MGLYDTVVVPCPNCGTKSYFQSKGGECVLETYELDEAPDDVMSDVNRHGPATCEKCHHVFDAPTRETEVQRLRAALREALDAWVCFADSFLNSHGSDYKVIADRIAALRKMCE
jgi:hypothetical protein